MPESQYRVCLCVQRPSRRPLSDPPRQVHPFCVLGCPVPTPPCYGISFLGLDEVLEDLTTEGKTAPLRERLWILKWVRLHRAGNRSGRNARSGAERPLKGPSARPIKILDIDIFYQIHSRRILSGGWRVAMECVRDGLSPVRTLKAESENQRSTRETQP